MALGGGGLAQGGSGLGWARLAAPRMGLVGLGGARKGLVGRSDGQDGPGTPRPMGLEEALHRTQASSLPAPLLLHFRSGFSTILNHFPLASKKIGP